MTDGDHELQQMFEAQRLADARRAPSFSEIEAAPPPRPPQSPTPTHRWAALVAAMLALAVGGGLLWISFDRDVSEPPRLVQAPSPELHQLNDTCDAVLHAIRQLPPSTSAAAELDMPWPDGTESLLPIELASYHRPERTLP